MSPPPVIIDHLSMIYQGLPSDIELNVEYKDFCEELREKAVQFEEIIAKVDKGLDYDLRELSQVDLIHIMDWPRPTLHAFHNVICKNDKGIITDEYVANFFLGMDPAYFEGVEQFEVKELG